MRPVTHNPTLQMHICINCPWYSKLLSMDKKPVCVCDWGIMSPLETCISILICISGYWFFISQIKRKSSPNHVHACLWVLYIQATNNTIMIVNVLYRV